MVIIVRKKIRAYILLESLVGLAILVTITSLVISEINRQQSHIARRQHEQEVLILARMAVQTDQKILEANGVNIRIEEVKIKLCSLKVIRKFCTYQKLRVKAFTLLECLVALVTITGALLVYQGLTKLLAQQIVVMSSSSQSEWVLLTQQLNAEFEGAHLEYLRQNKLYLRKQDKIVTFGKSNKDDFRKTGYDGRGYQPMVYGLDNCQMSQTKSMVKLVFILRTG